MRDSSLAANKAKRLGHLTGLSGKKMVWVYSELDKVTENNYPSPWAKQMRDGLSHGALLNEFQLVYESLERAPSDACSHIPEETLAGIIIIPRDDTDISTIVNKIPVETPIAVVNRHFSDEKIPSVDIDHYKGAFEATSFLLKIGHRRIMYVTLEEPIGVTETKRVEGYKQAFQQAGLDVDESLFVREPLGENWVHWPEIFRKALSLEPTAILLPNHGRVAHAVEIIKNQGFRMPEDISLIVFDDDPTLVRMTPSISAIRQPLDQMGRLAMELILKIKDAKESVPAHTRLEPELIVRGSVTSPGKSE